MRMRNEYHATQCDDDDDDGYVENERWGMTRAGRGRKTVEEDHDDAGDDDANSGCDVDDDAASAGADAGY